MSAADATGASIASTTAVIAASAARTDALRFMRLGHQAMAVWGLLHFTRPLLRK